MGLFAASGSGALNKINGIMEEEDFLQILHENLKSSVTRSWEQLGVPTGE